MEELEYQDLTVLSIETVMDPGSGLLRYRLTLGEITTAEMPGRSVSPGDDKEGKPSRASTAPRLTVELADKRAVQYPVGSLWRLSVREDGSMSLKPAKRIRTPRNDTVSRL